MPITTIKYPTILFLLFFSLPGHAADPDAFQRCILDKTEKADQTVRAIDIHQQCSRDYPETDQPGTLDHSPVHTRIQIDQTNQFKPFTLMAFKPNFILAATYNQAGYNADIYPIPPGESSIDLDSSEAQFQISIKTPLLINLFNKDINLYAGYTNRSFWQVYNSKLSRPFRETNHEPEIWLQTTRSTKILGFDNRINTLGLSHQSNGQGNILSRSWNRLYAQFAFEKQSFVFAIKIWERFSEDPATDDNPDIIDYMGHGEFRLVYSKQNHSLRFMSRNNLESGFERGATELSWSFPITSRKDMKGYIQIFSGYGESLIDYNQRVNRIGLGISLSDWL